MKKVGYGLAVLLLLGLIFSDGQRKVERLSSVNNSRQSQSNIWHRYFTTHHREDQWWLYTGPSSTNPLYDEIAVIEKLVKETIQKFAKTSPKTQEITKIFQKQFFTVLKGEQLMSPPGTTKKDYEIADIVFCFIPASEIKPTDLSTCRFDEDRTIYIYAIQWPEKFFPALLFHELGHALKIKMGLHGPQLIGSNEQMIEEVEMKSLGMELLNATTTNAFTQKLDAILNREKPKSLPSALGCINDDDLIALDRILNCEHAGRGLASVVTSYYLFGIAIQYTDWSKMNEKETQATKLTLFKEVDKILSTHN